MTTISIPIACRPKSGRTTYHRDGTVTVWDVMRQQWHRAPAGEVLRTLGPTLTRSERVRLQTRASVAGV